MAVKSVKYSAVVNLPEVIKNLEELVLAEAGVDAFEEILKLIYAKLYDEKTVENGGKTLVNDYTSTNGDIRKKIQFLFDRAKREWPGMFDIGDVIEVPSSHLAMCVELLWKIKLYKADLAIIDTAFEYLLPKAAKGSRGQYFTPRHVVVEVVKILNPKKGERILDPACGSGGFLLHAFKWIENHNSKIIASKIYGIDYDTRMVKIAKAMLFITGAEHINIFKANALAPLKELKTQTFDIVCTNPPFGGEVRDEALLTQYSLVKNSGKNRRFVERHILFIERIIQMLKPGGRAAIVVPQGILNNTSLSYIREWLYSQARIIGVIGMDTNIFKPHTNVKTSSLLLQKWKGKALLDYPVFMAVSNKSGKNLSGDLVYKTQNGKHIIDSDLPEITGELRRFIEREKLGF